MAIYHCSIKPVSRGSGRSGVAAAAYRAGVCLADERTGEVIDYTRRKGVLATAVYGFDGSREQLWNVAESTEKRCDARTAREIEIAIPHELKQDLQKELIESYVKKIHEKYGVAIDIAIHQSSKDGDQRNYHAHLLLTTRIVNPDGTLGRKSDLELSDTDLKKQGKPSSRQMVTDLRQQWAEIQNEALARVEKKARVSHLSLKAQGIERVPTAHAGVAASAMERRGVATDRGNINREVAKANKQIVNANRDAYRAAINERIGLVWGENQKKGLSGFDTPEPDYDEALKAAGWRDSDMWTKRALDAFRNGEVEEIIAIVEKVDRRRVQDAEKIKATAEAPQPGVDEREPANQLKPVVAAMERSEHGDLNPAPTEKHGTQVELTDAAKVQTGMEQMRGQLREWRITQELARQQAIAAEKAKEQERLARELAERRERNKSRGPGMGR